MTKKHYIENERIEELNGFLVGSRLGDGGFTQRTPQHNTYIVFKHAENQYEYLLWKKSHLHGLAKEEVKERNFTEGRKSTWQRQFYFSTVSLPNLNIYRKLSINELLDQIDELGFVVWILDDGNLYQNVWKLGCGRFTNDEKVHAAKVLNEKFDLNPGVYEHPTQNKGYLRFKKKDAEKINKLIIKHLGTELDIVKYKLSK